MDSFLPAGRTTSALSLEKRSVVPLQGREREGGIIQTARAPLCRACRDGATTTTFRSSSGDFGRGYRLPCISVRTGPDERFLSSARRSLVTHCIWVRGTARQAIIGGGPSSVRYSTVVATTVSGTRGAGWLASPKKHHPKAIFISPQTVRSSLRQRDLSLVALPGSQERRDGWVENQRRTGGEK